MHVCGLLLQSHNLQFLFVGLREPSSSSYCGGSGDDKLGGGRCLLFLEVFFIEYYSNMTTQYMYIFVDSKYHHRKPSLLEGTTLSSRTSHVLAHPRIDFGIQRALGQETTSRVRTLTYRLDRQGPCDHIVHSGLEHPLSDQ